MQKITHLNTFWSEDPDTVGQCRPAKMPPATLPNVFPAPEGFTEGSLLIKEPGTGNVSPVWMEATSFGKVSKDSFELCVLVVEVKESENRGRFADEVTDGLINAAIENNEVAWEECLRLISVVDADVELSEVGLIDRLLKFKKENFRISYIRENVYIDKDVWLL